jgi:hypothetical protein
MMELIGLDPVLEIAYFQLFVLQSPGTGLGGSLQGIIVALVELA